MNSDLTSELLAHTNLVIAHQLELMAAIIRECDDLMMKSIAQRYLEAYRKVTTAFATVMIQATIDPNYLEKASMVLLEVGDQNPGETQEDFLARFQATYDRYVPNTEI